MWKIQGYDLCAGDGVFADDEAFHRNTSPGIFAYHAQFAAGTAFALPVEAHLYEIKEANYLSLLAAMRRWLPEMHKIQPSRRFHPVPYQEVSEGVFRAGRVTVTLHHGDGASASLDGVDPYTAVLVLHDPNSMLAWPLTPEWLWQLHNRTNLVTLVNTMGCNVAGIKRISPEERDGWFTRVTAVLSVSSRWHDTLFASLHGDPAQWAYLITVPRAFWAATEKETLRSFEKHGFKLDTAWYRTDPVRFAELQEQHFLRKTEREAPGA